MSLVGLTLMELWHHQAYRKRHPYRRRMQMSGGSPTLRKWVKVTVRKWATQRQCQCTTIRSIDISYSIHRARGKRFSCNSYEQMETLTHYDDIWWAQRELLVELSLKRGVTCLSWNPAYWLILLVDRSIAEYEY